MHLDDLGSTAPQDFAQPAGAVAPHVVDDNLQAGVADGRDVDEFGQVRQVSRLGVKIGDLPAGQAVLKLDAADRIVGTGRWDGSLNLLETGGGNGATAGVADLEAAVLGGVVASRNIKRGQCVVCYYAVGNDGSRRGARSKQDLDAVACQHLAGDGGKMLSGEAAVVADDHRPIVAHGEQVGCISLGGTAYVGVCVIIANAPAPAVRAKLNVTHERLQRHRGWLISQSLHLVQYTLPAQMQSLRPDYYLAT